MNGEDNMLNWYGRDNLADTHKEERIINGVKVMVTVCRPGEASGSNWSMTWNEKIALDVEMSELDG
jgi:hypothetical protein